MHPHSPQLLSPIEVHLSQAILIFLFPYRFSMDFQCSQRRCPLVHGSTRFITHQPAPQPAPTSRSIASTSPSLLQHGPAAPPQGPRLLQGLAVPRARAHLQSLGYLWKRLLSDENRGFPRGSWITTVVKVVQVVVGAGYFFKAN